MHLEAPTWCTRNLGPPDTPVEGSNLVPPCLFIPLPPQKPDQLVVLCLGPAEGFGSQPHTRLALLLHLSEGAKLCLLLGKDRHVVLVSGCLICSLEEQPGASEISSCRAEKRR